MTIAALATPSLRARLHGVSAELRMLAPFFCLSATFGLTLGFLAGGAPLILRARGVDLAEVGLLQLINLPVGLTFFWAALIDRWRLPGLPHRIGWIVWAQGATAALLVLLSGAEHWPLGWLLGLAILTCACVATMDIALEALVVETVPARGRAGMASAKLCGASLGGILGVGVLVGGYDWLGWRGAVLACAGLDLLCLLPILRYPEVRLRRSIMARSGLRFAARNDAESKAPERAVLSVDRLRLLLPRILALGLYFAASYVLSGSLNLVLLDLGVSLGLTGFLTGTVMPAANLVMAAASGPLTLRFGTLRLIAVGAAGVAVSGVLMLAASALGSAALGIGAMLVNLALGGLLGVPVFGMIYRWARGPQPATDYALLFGAAFFAAMPLRVASPALAGAIGWPGYFAVAIPLYGVAVAWLARMIGRTLRADAVVDAGATESERRPVA